MLWCTSRDIASLLSGMYLSGVAGKSRFLCVLPLLLLSVVLPQAWCTSDVQILNFHVKHNLVWQPWGFIFCLVSDRFRRHSYCIEVCIKSSLSLFAAYIKRVITHPLFHNITFKESEKFMESMDQGDVIIRPSSKGESLRWQNWKRIFSCDSHYVIFKERP